MLTVISGNNRNGYPCALNKVGDIFKPGIPPFETEGLTDLGNASQKGGFPLAGLRGQMLGSVKVTASEESTGGAGVTVSMTSEDSAGYGKYDSESHLSSPKLASPKYHQYRSPMQGLCADNLLNRKAESEFVQAAGKEKGPALSQAPLSTSMISCTGESNELHHNLPLQATGFAECQPPSQPLGSMPRDCNLSRASCFNQFARLTPSRSASDSICSFKDGDIRILNCGDWPPPLGFLSLVVDKWPPIQLVSSLIGGHFKQVRPIIITPPSGADLWGGKHFWTLRGNDGLAGSPLLARLTVILRILDSSQKMSGK